MKAVLLYEYPPKLNRAEKQAKAAYDLAQHAKIRRNMLRNMILAAVIIGISFFVPNILVRILLLIIGLANAAVGALLYWFNMLNFDSKVYSRIFDDHLEHSQRMGFSKNYLHADIAYADIEKSEQDNHGNLVVRLKENHSARLCTTDENGENKQNYTLQDNTVTLKFTDTKAKLTLVSDLYEKINYPHKEYKVINDDDDDYYTPEDKKWDNLSKHGL